MTIVIPWWTGDRHQAERLLNWLKEIGGTHFPIMLMASKEANPDGLLPLAKECNSGSFVEYDYENITSDWHTSGSAGRSALGPNSLFRQTASYFHDWTGKGNGKGDFLYLEPDCVIVPREGKKWDLVLFEEYERCGQPFMGARVPAGDAYPEHMSGVAIWPQNTPELSQGVMRCEKGAFDVVGSQEIVPRAYWTNSIVHKFRHTGFKTQAEVDEWVKPDTLIFHANKDGSLIPFLRERLTKKGGDVICPTVTTDALNTTGTASALHAQNVEVVSNGAGSPTTSPAPNTVRTYYEKLQGRDHAQQEWLLATWADSWRKFGWHPVVIGPDLAKQHPYYQQFLKAYTDLPSVNGKDYELACYIRHVAMVQSGGGLLVDYDVINVGFTPDMLPETNGKYPAILADKNPCPCGVYGTAEEYDALCLFMANQGQEAIVIEGGRLHTSDQHFVQHFAAHFRSYEIIWQYGQKGWENAKLIHFSSGSCQGRSRSEVIPSAIELISVDNAPQHSDRYRLVNKANGHSWIGEVRELSDRLLAMGDTPMRKSQISQELRKRFKFKGSSPVPQR